MLRSKWLYAVGLAISAPIVLVLCVAAVNQYLSGEVSVRWRGGDRLPPGASASTEVYLIALVALCVWIGGLWKIVGMFRIDRSGG